MKRTIFKGGKMFALAAALLCSTAALGSTYAYADTAQDQAAQAAAQDQAFVPAVSGQITSCKITGDKQNIEIGFAAAGTRPARTGRFISLRCSPLRMRLEAAGIMPHRQQPLGALR